MFWLIIIMVIAAVSLVSVSLFTTSMAFLEKWRIKKEQTLQKELDKMFYDKRPQEIIRLYFILPPVLALIPLIFLNSVIFAIVGVFCGLFIPSIALRLREAKRRIKFSNQILDTIMVITSSLKGGLSLLQALEVVVEEMPAPMSQEIGLVIRENKMGLSLEECLGHLRKRMNMEELTLVINSILVARETGGDLTKVLSRLSTTVRDNRKLKDNIQTLTLQGRLQGVIMSSLPFLFVVFVLSADKHHFDVMLQQEIGKILIFVAVFLQIIGMILIKKFSTIKV